MLRLILFNCLILVIDSNSEPCIPQLHLPILQQVTPPVDHGEVPSWDSRKNLLYYVDIRSGTIYSYNFTSSEINSIRLNGVVAPVIQTEDPNVLIAGLTRSVVAIRWNGRDEIGTIQNLTTVSQQFPDSRFNDGKADKNGRLWIGTMGQEGGPNGVELNQGVLYKITEENLANPTVAISPVNISNGLAWNKANTRFYYIDTFSGVVAEYKYKLKTGEITFNRVAFELSKFSNNVTGFMDGLTIDEDDNLWIAVNSGGAVIKVDSGSGELLQVIAIPSRDVTSLIWGGPNLDILFVTTARYQLTEEQRKQQLTAGSVFAISNLGTRGLPEFKAHIIDIAG